MTSIFAPIRSPTLTTGNETLDKLLARHPNHIIASVENQYLTSVCAMVSSRLNVYRPVSSTERDMNRKVIGGRICFTLDLP